MPIEQMSIADYQTLTWEEERGIFTLRTDDTALGGYRIEGFSVGTELLLEVQLMDYTNAILMEYSNSKLGFFGSVPEPVCRQVHHRECGRRQRDIARWHPQALWLSA